MNKYVIAALFISCTIQCSEDAGNSILSKENLMREIEDRLDYKDFIQTSANNFFELSKTSSDDRHEIENLSDELLSDYYRNDLNFERMERFKALTTRFSIEPVNQYSSLKDHLSSHFTYSQDDLIMLLDNAVSSEIADRILKNHPAGRVLQLPVPIIDVCGVVCAVKTENSGLENTTYSSARTIFYWGCYTGCYAVL